MGTFLGVQAYGRVGISLVDWKYMKGGGKSVITVPVFRSKLVCERGTICQ